MTTKPDVDMSPKAVSGRIEMIRALYKLCMALKQAGKALPSDQRIDRSG